MSTPNKHKTVSLPEDVIRATEMFLAARRGGKGPQNFSAAVAQGLRLVLSHNKTSVPKMLATAGGAAK